MTAALLEAANDALRSAVRERMENTDPSDPKMHGYDRETLKKAADHMKNLGEFHEQRSHSPLAGCQPAQECAAKVLSDAWKRESRCEGQRLRGDSLLNAGDDPYAEWTPPAYAREGVHPTSQAYFDLLDTLRRLHLSKSAGYGCPDGTDPLMNIRRGAEFVGIPAWQGAMVRLSDKVTRLSVFNKTRSLPHESVEDTLLDLASYSLLALLLYREEQ
jgi:hypothetical protein